MLSKKKSELKSKAYNLNPNIRVGKNGLTDNITIEVKKQLKQHKLIKIKFLKSSLPIEKANLEKLSLDTSSEIIENKGNTLVLYKN
jgi:RNA-binding protein